MSDAGKINQARKRPLLQVILFVLTLLSLPLACCSGTFFLDALPASLLPSQVDFIVNSFEEEARVENRSGETLYITPISTTYGHPVVIAQLAFIQQRDIPLQPNHSVVLTYDAADMPLSGIAVCRANEECRLLAADHSNTYYLDSFESLPELEPSWLLAIQSHPQYNVEIVLMLVLGLVPVVLFASWLYLVRLEKKRAGN